MIHNFNSGDYTMRITKKMEAICITKCKLY